jgi:hypothetical protein
MAEYSLVVKIGLSFTYTNYISGSHNMAEGKALSSLLESIQPYCDYQNYFCVGGVKPYLDY